MAKKFLRTSDIAKYTDVHPNTVRLYEEWGYLPPIPRSPSSYRMFTQKHADQMLLARTALVWPYPGGKEIVDQMVRSAANDDFGTALELAYRYQANIRSEIVQAEAAIKYLEHWVQGKALETSSKPILINETAKRLGLTADILRNWERNGLITVQRHPKNNYRLYGSHEIGRLRVIRTLRQGGYSLMSILRMLTQLDAGKTEDLRQALDTPDPQDDIIYVTDHWLSTLADQEKRSHLIINQIERMISNHS